MRAGRYAGLGHHLWQESASPDCPSHHRPHPEGPSPLRSGSLWGFRLYRLLSGLLPPTTHCKQFQRSLVGLPADQDVPESGSRLWREHGRERIVEMLEPLGFFQLLLNAFAQQHLRVQPRFAGVGLHVGDVDGWLVLVWSHDPVLCDLHRWLNKCPIHPRRGSASGIASEPSSQRQGERWCSVRIAVCAGLDTGYQTIRLRHSGQGGETNDANAIAQACYAFPSTPTYRKLFSRSSAQVTRGAADDGRAGRREEAEQGGPGGEADHLRTPHPVNGELHQNDWDRGVDARCEEDESEGHQQQGADGLRHLAGLHFDPPMSPIDMRSGGLPCSGSARFALGWLWLAEYVRPEIVSRDLVVGGSFNASRELPTGVLKPLRDHVERRGTAAGLSGYLCQNRAPDSRGATLFYRVVDEVHNPDITETVM